ETTSAMTYGGGTFSGAVAPGIGFSLEPLEGLLIRAGGAVFFPQQSPADGRDFYGWEVDFQAGYEILRNTDVYLEAARFEYGNYFKDNQDRVPDAALFFSLGCRTAF
ncbi:MAG: hypothetical protein P8X55_05095, partial [Desulfosarcinaceae bacterium]